MKWVSAIVLSSLSAFMGYFMIGVFVLPILPENMQALFAPIILLLVFLGSLSLLLHETQSAAKVWARGSLLGAAEWVGMSAVMVGLSGAVVFDAAGQTTTAGLLGLSLMMSLLSMVGVGFSMMMIVLCLLTWFIASRCEREFQPAAVPRSCPHCQQTLDSTARECPSCYAILQQDHSPI